MRRLDRTSPIVVARLNGGLGNQMFQYAAGRALALRHGVELKLDVSAFATDPKRRYELGPFPIRGALASGADRSSFGLPSKPGPRWVARARRVLGVDVKPGCWPIYRERHFQFDPALRDLSPPVYMDGYWQSEKYFLDCAQLIREELKPQTPLELENDAVAARIDAVNAVSLHIRRGDYVSEPVVARRHGTCSFEYYREAVDYIAGRVNDIHLFVFSDDHQWTRDNLSFSLPSTLVKANTPDRGFRDMQLMTRCRHHILANSSFSWWGAWLNSAPDKIVVAPRQWFRMDGYDTVDLIPEGWVRL